LCFFVLLLSFAEQDAQKYRDVVGSLKDTFGAKVIRSKSDDLDLMTTSTTADKAAPSSDDSQVMAGVIIKLKSLIQDDKRFKNTSGIAADREGALMYVQAGAIFKPGSAQLTSEAKTALDRVIAVLEEYPINLVVRGHTDDMPTNSAHYPSNWELSAARAANALAYIVDIGGIPDNRVKAVGYADTRPVKPNVTEEGRRANQRVEFFFHKPNNDAW
ncbi:MAG: OmpA family protein, partial [Proteobacteria bacterium]|nr:OmpA family protein [Pseudomonadota bacterium]